MNRGKRPAANRTPEKYFPKDLTTCIILCYNILPNKEKRHVMYTDKNFPTKKAFKEAVASGSQVRLFAPGMGSPKVNGTDFVEGPHYPKPHSWYAEVTVTNGLVTKVK